MAFSLHDHNHSRTSTHSLAHSPSSSAIRSIHPPTSTLSSFLPSSSTKSSTEIPFDWKPLSKDALGCLQEQGRKVVPRSPTAHQSRCCLLSVCPPRRVGTTHTFRICSCYHWAAEAIENLLPKDPEPIPRLHQVCRNYRHNWRHHSHTLEYTQTINLESNPTFQRFLNWCCYPSKRRMSSCSYWTTAASSPATTCLSVSHLQTEPAAPPDPAGGHLYSQDTRDSTRLADDLSRIIDASAPLGQAVAQGHPDPRPDPSRLLWTGDLRWT